MVYTILTYRDLADELNHDFRTVLSANATEVGVSIVPKGRLDLRRLAANIEMSRAVVAKPGLKVTTTDCGIICVR